MKFFCNKIMILPHSMTCTRVCEIVFLQRKEIIEYDCLHPHTHTHTSIHTLLHTHSYTYKDVLHIHTLHLHTAIVMNTADSSWHYLKSLEKQSRNLHTALSSFILLLLDILVSFRHPLQIFKKIWNNIFWWFHNMHLQ